jgi:quercetin dioxygenase-like cupin family protein
LIRNLLLSVAGILASITASAAADGEGALDRRVGEIVVRQLMSSSVTSAGEPVALPQKDVQVVVSTYDIPSGAKLPVHKHLFPRYGYVLDGVLEVTNTETGKTESFKAGEFILESVGHWHRGSNAGNVPLRLLVIDLVEKGRNNTVLKD